MFKKGFTLIELLVVISIIGLLSSVVLASLNTARAKARDTRRISDLRQVQTALSLCYDKIGSFNFTSETFDSSCNREPVDDGNLVAGWEQCSEFMAKFPVDPLSSPTRQYTLHTTSNYQRVALLAVLETSQYTMTTAQVTSFLTSLGITGWAQCPEYNYVIGQ